MNIVFLIGRMLVASSFAVAAGQARPDDPSVERARRILQLFLDGSHAEFVATGTEDVLKQFSAEKSREVLDALKKQYGPFAKELDATPKKLGKLNGVIFRLRFEKSIIKLQMALDAKGQMASFLIVGVESIKGWRPPRYVKKDRFETRAATVQHDNIELPAVLTLPVGDQRVPGLVLVHGSGPHDEDETIGPNKPFRDLAEGLASMGVAVLRYEKRTHKYGTEMKAEDVTLAEETIDDALAAAALLRKEPRVDPDRVFVLGHSLGGMAAPFIAARDEQLAGIVILAGSARPLVDIVEEQIAFIANADGSLSEEEKKQIEEVHQAAEAIRAGKLDEVRKPLLGAPSAYWQRISAMDPVAEAAKLRCPMLIIQGGRDYQVTTKCFDRWKAGLTRRSDVTFRLYDQLNHLMITGKGPPSPADYGKAGHVSKKVVQDIADWILPPATGQPTTSPQRQQG